MEVGVYTASKMQALSYKAVTLSKGRETKELYPHTTTQIQLYHNKQDILDLFKLNKSACSFTWENVSAIALQKLVDLQTSLGSSFWNPQQLSRF